MLTVEDFGAEFVEDLAAELLAAGGAVRVGVAARCDGIGREPNKLPPPELELRGVEVLGERLVEGDGEDVREDPSEPLLDEGRDVLLLLEDLEGLL